MLIERTFYISVSKKRSQTEVFGFETKTQLPDDDNPDDLYVRDHIARRLCVDSRIPVEYRGSGYWVSAVCIDY